MGKYQFNGAERAAIEKMPVPLAVYQFAKGQIYTLALSDGFCSLFGYPDREQAIRSTENDVFYNTHPDDVARISQSAYRFATEGGKYEVIFRARKYEGKEDRIFHGVGEHVYSRDGVRLAYVWYTDEGAYTGDEDKQASALNRAFNSALHEESIVRTSRYDYLTGLPSMTYFFELAGSRRKEIGNSGGIPTLLYMDLHGMKHFNLKYGYAEGDRLLLAFSRCLERLFGHGSCSRFEADHFVAVTELEGLEEKLQRLFDEARLLNESKSLPVHVGIYPQQEKAVIMTMACDRAKFACDALRSFYTSDYNFYSQDMRDERERREYIVENLDRALKEKWIQVYYQPIVRAVNGRVCDEEALARWIDPEFGFLSPAEFIPTLEEAGLIYRLDLYVLDQVLEKIRVQEKAGLFVVPQSVNLSRSDFDACDIVEEIRRRVDDAGVSRDKITIEITESVVGSDFEFMKEQVERFKELGFPVWMDDFGSGYSSLDVLQSIRFTLLKFDMSFMKKLDENGGTGKIVLTELMRMATALGIETVCEGVETKEQVQFLREIGCSKLQGFYYQKPIPMQKILERYEKGIQIGFENPESASYYEQIGRVNLYDLAVISNEKDYVLQNFFNTIPMGIMEVTDGKITFIRTNQSCREFLVRFFNFDPSMEERPEFDTIHDEQAANFVKHVRLCCTEKNRAFFDDELPDGSVVHIFVRKVGQNPVTGTYAAVIAVLSVADKTEGASYAGIARALAADYYHIYYVDLDTGKFIEYSSPVGGEELAEERHGRNFFDTARRDIMKGIFEEDREAFLKGFTREEILKELDRRGVFKMTYRLLDGDEPRYVLMKINRMQPDGRHLIIGVNSIDSQLRQMEAQERLLRERTAFGRIAALSGKYLSLYTVDPLTEDYIEFSAMSDYDALGIAKKGSGFFATSQENGKKAVHPDDLAGYMQVFTKENVLRCIGEKGFFKTRHRILLGEKYVLITVKAAMVQESGEDKLIVGVKR